EEPLGHRLQLPRALDDQLEGSLHPSRVAREQTQLRLTENPGEKIVALVRDAGRQLPYRRPSQGTTERVRTLHRAVSSAPADTPLCGRCPATGRYSRNSLPTPDSL